MSRAGEGGGLQNRCRNTTVGPNPTKRSTHHWLNLAEQGTLNAWVEGSSPSWCTNLFRCKYNMENEFICKFCGKECKNENSQRNHERLCKENPNKKTSPFVKWNATHNAWNKGLTEETDDRVKQSRNTWRENLSLGKFKPVHQDKHLSKDHKQAISNSMKLAHKEGRAHNIGESRWNNEHSYPEKWLIKVLENEFGMKEHIDYKTEMSFGRFALDFAWPDRKLCIEIDGKQHQTDEIQKIRDNNKDKLLNENGWNELRIPWSDCCNNTKIWIEKIKLFLS